ncbi:hypothetical protein BDB00DRAFT_847202 [Zychaea mexicana]|uniref:uncharacterized protein n=1 Tax=Zychaea mexicana TaxID=64656 RepID=UPI0022FEC421|nr:uncharacterized protein BDB00DRAFT_847202 [Zychaea mexicana]KAI9488636.1 hypothetical protein BDB00DRAFT_847202 [Zychaea mexicana]
MSTLQLCCCLKIVVTVDGYSFGHAFRAQLKKHGCPDGIFFDWFYDTCYAKSTDFPFYERHTVSCVTHWMFSYLMHFDDYGSKIACYWY